MSRFSCAKVKPTQMLPNILLWLALTTTSRALDVEDVVNTVDEDNSNTTPVSHVLPRISPAKVGEEWEIQLVPWTTHTVKALNAYPPILEVSNFLTDVECNYLIDAAKQEGLQNSRTVGEQLEITEESFLSSPLSDFHYWDYNTDSVITVDELQDISQRAFGFEVELSHTNWTLRNTGLDKDGDGVVTEGEFNNRNIETLVDFFNAKENYSSEKKIRESMQAWIPRSVESHDAVLRTIEKRVAALTKLPLKMVQFSEEMQVVQYRPGGHYNCHLDSDPKNAENYPCCHIEPYKECQICRYITVLYYLNDVKSGGETAFPIAGSTRDGIAWTQGSANLCDLSKNCHLANLQIVPKKGKVVFWYNHFRNSTTQWLGDIDSLSFHGGCQVLEGEKWIANHWIDVSYDRIKDEQNWKMFTKHSIRNVDKNS